MSTFYAYENPSHKRGEGVWKNAQKNVEKLDFFQCYGKCWVQCYVGHSAINICICNLTKTQSE